MTRKNFLHAIILAITLAFSPTLFAQSSGLYLDISVAHSSTSIDDLTLENLPLPDIFQYTPRFTTDSQNTSTHSSWMITGGYQFNRILSIEAFYMPLGEFTREISGRGLADIGAAKKNNINLIGGATQFTTKDKLTLKSYGVTALASLPITRRFSIFGKIGECYWNGNLKHSTSFVTPSVPLPAPYTYTDTDSGTTPIIGFGALYNVMYGVSLRADWSIIRNVGGSLSTGQSNITIYSIGAQIIF